jgi:hypothetical protein
LQIQLILVVLQEPHFEQVELWELGLVLLEQQHLHDSSSHTPGKPFGVLDSLCYRTRRSSLLQ